MANFTQEELTWAIKMTERVTAYLNDDLRLNTHNAILITLIAVGSLCEATDDPDYYIDKAIEMLQNGHAENKIARLSS